VLIMYLMRPRIVPAQSACRPSIDPAIAGLAERSAFRKRPDSGIRTRATWFSKRSTDPKQTVLIFWRQGLEHSDQGSLARAWMCIAAKHVACRTPVGRRKSFDFISVEACFADLTLSNVLAIHADELGDLRQAQAAILPQLPKIVRQSVHIVPRLAAGHTRMKH